MEWYRSGHNEHDWKSCDGQKPSEGSNPSHSAKVQLAQSGGLNFFCVKRTTGQPVVFFKT